MTTRDLLSGIYDHKITVIGYIVAIMLLSSIAASQATRKKMIKRETKRTINYINLMAEKFMEAIGDQKNI